MGLAVRPDLENLPVGHRSGTLAAAAAAAAAAPPAPLLTGAVAGHRGGFRRGRYGNVDHGFLGSFFPAPSAAAAAPFAPAVTLAMLNRTLGNNDGVGLGLTLALGAQRLVLRFLFFANRRDADGRTRGRLACRILGQLA